jgi:hypothetical protein
MQGRYLDFLFHPGPFGIPVERWWRANRFWLGHSSATSRAALTQLVNEMPYGQGKMNPALHASPLIRALQRNSWVS